VRALAHLNVDNSHMSQRRAHTPQRQSAAKLQHT